MSRRRDNWPTRPSGAELVIERTSPVFNKYLWLKTVHAVNLSVHCYSSLVGQPLHVHNSAQRQHVQHLPAAPAYYLCGVTEPYRWELNSHLLLVPDPGAGEWAVATTPTMRVAMWGLRSVPITADWLEDVYGGQEAYTSCRNLQAAWLLHREHGLRNQPGRTPKLADQQKQQAAARRPARTRGART